MTFWRPAYSKIVLYFTLLDKEASQSEPNTIFVYRKLIAVTERRFYKFHKFNSWLPSIFTISTEAEYKTTHDLATPHTVFNPIEMDLV